MSRRTFVLLAVLALAVSVLTPITALAQEAGSLTQTATAVSVAGSAPAPASPKQERPVEVDKAAILAAMSRARSVARAEGVAIGEGFLAAGKASVIVSFDESTTAADVAAAVGGEVLAQYSRVMNGAALLVSTSKLDALGAVPGVTGVFANEFRQTQTTVSPEFIEADEAWDELGGPENAGEGVVVGVVDTGIWPEHPSFADDGTFPAPPPSWTGTNCDFGSSTPGDAPFTCNNKLIGATWAMPAYASSGLLLPTEFRSARDDNGHGTHTASTAAGNHGVPATLLGIPRGEVSGIAPRAHVAMYKACGDLGCFGSDLVLAIDQAVADGVDVINYSIGGGQSDPYTDADALAFLAALDAGVFVATSAGNSGPGPNTVGSPGDAPWITTVGASTTDRFFISEVTVTADNGDTLTMEGASVTTGISTPTEVVMADPADPLCLESTPGTYDYTGKIVVCERGAIARVAKSFNAMQQGAVGMLLYNPTLQGLATDNHFIPSVHLEVNDGTALVDFVTTHTGVMATFTQGTATEVQGDVMAAFSSRGGDGYLTIKPDVTAPGVQILAGHTPLPAGIEGGVPGELFQSIQGTSMSSPHVAGAGALLVQMHPDWSPAQIKSALMMSARTKHVTKEDGVTPADAFDMGSGRIDLEEAGEVGLTLDESASDFLANQGKEWNDNLASIWIPVLPGKITVQRTFTNEIGKTKTWKIKVKAPKDLKISVPKKLKVPKNGEATLDITIDARRVPEGEIRMATLILDGPGADLHIPIAIKRQQAAVTLSKSCDPTELKQFETTTCTIDVTNTTFETVQVDVLDNLPKNFFVVPGSVVGADQTGVRRVEFSGALAPAIPPPVSIVQEPAPFGYFSLASLGVSPAPLPGNPDDGALLLSGLDFWYAGNHYVDGIWSVNGTIEAGTASGTATGGANAPIPDPTLPNNLIVPWWTDLDMTSGGNWYSATLSAGGPESWDVFEWENVPRFGDPSSTFTFQVWIERGTDKIWFTYASSTGDTTDGTVGAETADGTVGDQYYFDGVGTNPWDTPGTDLRVLTGAPTPGETHTITFDALAVRHGKWRNDVEMTSDAFEGTAIASESGKIKKRRPPWRGRHFD